MANTPNSPHYWNVFYSLCGERAKQISNMAPEASGSKGNTGTEEHVWLLTVMGSWWLGTSIDHHLLGGTLLGAGDTKSSSL